MIDHEHGADLPDDRIRESLRATGDRPTPEFAASLRATLADAAAGRTTAPVTAASPRAARWRPLLAAAAAIVLIAGAVAVLRVRDGSEVATMSPPTNAPADATTPDATRPDATADHPTTAALLSEWVGVRLNGLGNGAVAGEYPWFEIQSIDVETGAVRMVGNDGCNDWASRGTIVDDRFEHRAGEAQGQECGTGTFEVRTGDAFVVRDDGIDIERGGVVHPFGPDPVVANAATLIDRRQFIDTTPGRSFPFSISFDGSNAIGSDGCGSFGATAEYGESSVRLVDVEAQCSNGLTPTEGDVVEIVDDTAVRLRRGSNLVIVTLAAVNDRLRSPSDDWLLGEWTLGSGRVTFGQGTVVLGECRTSWELVDGLVVVAPLADDCVTGLFPDTPAREQSLRRILGRSLAVHSLPSEPNPARAAVLRSGVDAIRLDGYPADPTSVEQLVGRTWVGVDGPWRTTSPTLLFDSLDREPGLLGVVVDTGCNRGGGTFRLDGDQMTTTGIAVEEAGCEHEVAHLLDGTTLDVDDGVLTVTSSVGDDISTTYVALDSLIGDLSPDLSGDWLANGTPISIEGRSVAGPVDDAFGPAALVHTALAEGRATTFRFGDGWLVDTEPGLVQLVPN